MDNLNSQLIQSPVEITHGKSARLIQNSVLSEHFILVYAVCLRIKREVHVPEFSLQQ